MGRPRKPDHLKRLAGDQPCRLRPTVQGVGKLGDPPAWLDPVATECWIGIRDAAPWLTGSDALILEIYANSYSDWRKCCAIIDRDGMILTTVKVHRSMVRGETGRTIIRKRHPLFSPMIQLAAFMIHVGDLMGLNPRSRARLGLDRPWERPGDALAEFISDK